METNGPDHTAILALTVIGGRVRSIHVLEDLQVADIARARDHGASWRMIGCALGTSAQAAWEKYHTPIPHGPLPGEETLPLE